MNVASKTVGWLLAAALLGGSASAAEADKQLRVTGSVWAPYIDPSRPNNGLAADLVTTALRRAGYSLDSEIETWPRAYRGTAIGVYDVVASVWKTPAREADLVFSEPYLMNDIVLMSKRGRALPFEGLDDLVGFTIGVENEFAYGGGFDERADLRKVVSNSLIQNLLLLRQGKVDLVIGDRWSIYYELTNYLPDAVNAFEMLPNALVRRALHMGVSRQNPEAGKILADFNRELEAMNADGTYREILDLHTRGLAVVEPGR